jgi:hypothetical protein
MQINDIKIRDLELMDDFFLPTLVAARRLENV